MAKSLILPEIVEVLSNSELEMVKLSRDGTKELLR